MTFESPLIEELAANPLKIHDGSGSARTQNLPQELGHPLRMMNQDKRSIGCSLYGS